MNTRKKPTSKHDYADKKNICRNLLNYGKCEMDAKGKCKKKHLVLMDKETTAEYKLCNKIFPHTRRGTSCKFLHIQIESTELMRYLRNNLCYSCKSRENSCKERIHLWQLQYLIKEFDKNDKRKTGKFDKNDKRSSEPEKRIKPRTTKVGDYIEYDDVEIMEVKRTIKKTKAEPIDVKTIESAEEKVCWADLTDDEFELDILEENSKNDIDGLGLSEFTK